MAKISRTLTLLILLLAASCSYSQDTVEVLVVDSEGYDIRSPQEVVTLAGVDPEQVAENKKDIADNKTSIGSNLTRITTNSNSIQTNSTHIATNTTAIAGKEDKLPSIAGNAGEVLTVNADANGLEWGPGGGSAIPLSDSTPHPLGTAAPGVDKTASRGDHVHQLPPQIATNRTDITTNINDIKTNAANVAKNTTAIANQAYPAFTGNAGKVLAVNTGATGVEWIEGGAGSGSVGTFGFTNIKILGPASSLNRTFSGDDCDKIRAGNVIVEAKSNFGRSSSPIEIISSISNYPFNFFLRFTTNFVISIVVVESGTCQIAIQVGDTSLWPTITSFGYYELGSGGGGGGGPSIPDPTPAGALKTLRVNSAGAAYELGVIAADANDLQELSDHAIPDIGTLEDQTRDLSVGTTPDWKTNDDSSEGIQIGASLNADGQFANTINRPSSGWPTTGRVIWAKLKKESDPLQYQGAEFVGTPQRFIAEDLGATWIRQDHVSLTHNFYLVSRGLFQSSTKVELQVHDAGPGSTSYSGHLTGSDFTNLKTEVEGYNKTIEYIEAKTPGDLTIQPGHVWTVQNCTGSGDQHKCEADWIRVPPLTPDQVQRTIIDTIATGTTTTGTGGGSAMFAQTGGAALLHNHIISARYRQMFVYFHWQRIVPAQEEIFMCMLPGVAPNITLNAFRRTVLRGYYSDSNDTFSACTLDVPASGNAQLAWSGRGGPSGNATLHWTITGERRK